MASLSASAENLTGDNQINDSSSMCLELALEGERLCKSGDCRAGVAFFQAAIQAGTDDLRTLSAIYSQLGNAYFYLGDYGKAMQYHKLDLTLARSMDDRLGEAKSSGNLGNTLKVMGRFDEAAICCERHLTLARQLGDRLSEGRALYNLGNVYHAKGKHLGQSNPGDITDEVKDSLLKAVEFYQQNLTLMKELGDRGAQGRACGNLGNTYYLLGDFELAIENHEERLSIAREFGDKPAERRANSNLGNSHIFLGQFDQAADHYKRTLSLAIELGERAVEAQACYSLGNTYTLLTDFQTAIDYHQRHLAIAQELGDRVGEARACWSLGNANSSISNHEKALYFAQSHYRLAKELGDTIGESTARMNISDLRKILGFANSLTSPGESMEKELSSDNQSSNDDAISQTNSLSSSNSRRIRVRRQSMEQLDLIKLTPDAKRLPEAVQPTNDIEMTDVQKSQMNSKRNEDDFFDLLTKSQSKRMDDQRCSLKIMSNSGKRKPLIQQNTIATCSTAGLSVNDIGTIGGGGSGGIVPKENRNALIEMIADLQSERMDEQRAILPGLRRSIGPNNNINTNSNSNRQQPASGSAPAPDEAFLDMLMRCQSSRIEEQRSELPRPSITMDVEYGESNRPGGSNIGATVPDEDFFSLIMRVQGGRMEDQRAAVPFSTTRTNNSATSALNRDNKNSSNTSISSNKGALPKKSK